MGKGWGLTLDSDPVTSNFFTNKSNSTTTVAGGSFIGLKLHHHHRDMFQFPVSLSGSRDNDRRGTSASSSPSDDTKIPVDEVDFFSDKKVRVVDDVKKESIEAPASDLDVNVSLVRFCFFESFFFV